MKLDAAIKLMVKAGASFNDMCDIRSNNTEYEIMMEYRKHWSQVPTKLVDRFTYIEASHFAQMAQSPVIKAHMHGIMKDCKL